MEEPQHWRVRPELPAPASGALPLPQGGLPRIPSAFEPRSLADMSEFAVSIGGPPLTAAAPCDKVQTLPVLQNSNPIGS